MKPFLTNSRPLLTETLPTWCLPIAKLLTTDEQLSEVSDFFFFFRSLQFTLNF